MKGDKTSRFGGLIGATSSGVSIENSYVTASVRSQKSVSGGLVGGNGGTIDKSYAIGAVWSSERRGTAGGLIGSNLEGQISNCYASGSTKGGVGSEVGGLVGGNSGDEGFGAAINASYSTGTVTGPDQKADVGGLVGFQEAQVTSSYWDTSKSGTDKGVGNGNDAGITGLTTKKLKSGLPSGFDPAIWAENPSINNGLPNLINNPPQ